MTTGRKGVKSKVDSEVRYVGMACNLIGWPIFLNMNYQSGQDAAPFSCIFILDQILI